MRFSCAFFVLAACSGSPVPSPTPPIVNQAPPPVDAAPDAPPPVDLVAAAALYQAKACIACHTIDGTAKVGKSSKGIFGSTVTLTDGSEVTVDEAFIRESLLEPNAKVSAGFPPSMPSYKGVLTDAEIDMLIAYIKSLR